MKSEFLFVFRNKKTGRYLNYMINIDVQNIQYASRFMHYDFCNDKYIRCEYFKELRRSKIQKIEKHEK
jgi:hypothetical protein